jgi:hypothetical protein
MEKLIELKAIAALVSMLSATSLVAFGKIGDGVYSTVMVATIAAFLAAQAFTERPAP